MILQALVQRDNQMKMGICLWGCGFFFFLQITQLQGKWTYSWRWQKAAAHSWLRFSCCVRPPSLWLLSLSWMGVRHLDFSPAACSHASTTCLICKQNCRESNGRLTTHTKWRNTLFPILCTISQLNWKFFRSITALKLGLYSDWHKRTSSHLLISVSNNTWRQLKKVTPLLKTRVALKKWAMTANAFLGIFEPILHGIVNSVSDSPKIW